MFAMAMSTADSILNVTSSMVTYDIVNPLRKNKLTDKQQLYLAKVACFSIGIFSIFLALSASKYKNALFRLFLLAADIGNPTFVAPFLLAVFGFRCKEKNSRTWYNSWSYYTYSLEKIRTSCYQWLFCCHAGQWDDHASGSLQSA